MKKTLNISVGALVEYHFRSGDLFFDTFTPVFPRDSIFAHQKVQKSRPDSYESEVPISNKFEINNYIVEINGRMDGVFRYPDRFIIEEIKTTNRDLDDPEIFENPTHWAQLRIYSYLFALEEQLDEIEGQLTYYQLYSGRIKECLLMFTIEELAVFINEILTRYVERIESLDNWQKFRDESIRRLEFPFSQYRPGQREMAVATYLAIKNSNQIIIQAATGIGKTMSVILPSLKTMMEGLSSKIFYLTARTTGKKSAENAIKEFRSSGLKLKSLTVTAKEKICFNQKMECSPDECDYAKGYYDRLDKAVLEFYKYDSFLRETIEKIALEFKICPFEFSLELSLFADLIICDYNYIFDPRVYLRRFFSEDNNDFIFLVDEAHNLVDRSREMFSAEIFKQDFLDTRRPLKKILPVLYNSLGKINSWMLKYRKLCGERKAYILENRSPDGILPLVRNFLKATEDLVRSKRKIENREKVINLYFKAKGFLRVAEEYDSSYATIYEKNGRDLRLKLFCIDPSTHLIKTLNKGRSSIFFSATMSPLHYFKRLFGCDESTKTLTIPSPFPEENLCVIIFEGISTLYKQREKTRENAAQLIAPIIKGRNGNYLLFFPSYAYMKMIHSTFTQNNPEVDTIIQNPRMSEEQRTDFLSNFLNDNSTTLAGFAVMGGVFGEGIDLVGERLSGAVIFGVGLPALSPERDLIRNYFTDMEGAGFEYAFLFPGIIRVLQAAGRVIRTEKDRGIVVLIDDRFKSPRYKSLFPKEWTPVRVNNLEYLSKILEDFWDEKA